MNGSPLRPRRMRRRTKRHRLVSARHRLTATTAIKKHQNNTNNAGRLQSLDSTETGADHSGQLSLQKIQDGNRPNLRKHHLARLFHMFPPVLLSLLTVLCF